MQELDFGILVLMGLSGWSCFRHGFTRSVRGILSIALGVLMANQFWPLLASLIVVYLEKTETAKWISVIVIVVSVSIMVDFCLERFGVIIEKGVLGWINSMIGAVFGVVFSCILIGTILLFAQKYGGATVKNLIANSNLAPTLIITADQFLNFGRQVVEEQADKFS